MENRKIAVFSAILAILSTIAMGGCGKSKASSTPSSVISTPESVSDDTTSVPTSSAEESSEIAVSNTYPNVSVSEAPSSMGTSIGEPFYEEYSAPVSSSDSESVVPPVIDDTPGGLEHIIPFGSAGSVACISSNGRIPARLKIMQVIRGDDAKNRLDEYNDTHSTKVEIQMDNDAVESVIVDFDIIIPSEANVPADGASPSLFEFRLTSREGTNQFGNTIMNATSANISDSTEPVQAGETIHCSYLTFMLKDVPTSDFLICFESVDNMFYYEAE